MNEDDIEYKQNFLRTQIIDEGYEPEEFSKFLSDEKGDIGLDLNNWKFEDLKNSEIDTFEIMPSLNEIKTIKEYINCKKQEKNEFTEIDNFKIKISK